MFPPTGEEERKRKPTRKRERARYRLTPSHLFVAQQSGRGRAIRLDRRNADLEHENDRLRCLYRLLGELPESEACEVLRRVRTAEDPLLVLNHIVKGKMGRQGRVSICEV
ncbi:hypothetical protein SLS62_002126 [Diatrype stigma]|uniref:Uncharacterized protein n=1 Tax=Diatrype stigma TaxID=117547 RepID=A0AAN9YVY5_9PEZI